MRRDLPAALRRAIVRRADRPEGWTAAPRCATMLLSELLRARNPQYGALLEGTMDLGLRDKLALVTGGSRGIGLRIARALADEGTHVAICGRTQETLDEAVADLRARGVQAHAIVADVTAPGESERFVEEGAKALGGLDLLVCNAGGASGGRFPEAT